MCGKRQETRSQAHRARCSAYAPVCLRLLPATLSVQALNFILLFVFWLFVLVFRECDAFNRQPQPSHYIASPKKPISRSFLPSHLLFYRICRQSSKHLQDWQACGDRGTRVRTNVYAEDSGAESSPTIPPSWRENALSFD
eukprot:6198766-Pleurochrysis_carterae.AAC.1